ncbi:class I SAM-dependent methyltransferase [Sediminibacter sp. Hel_I_10]|uniref:class I SAM-dependent methyltransferase n=1 Tax=Sediminibacter sp. Hel_I_10 TaxID=1392490 RepID=UPI00047AC9F4|nr:class I SAM-dependent methyltransferase [Sediminibacter sp. Hel_I_10]
MKKDHLKNTLIRICSQPRTLEFISKKMGGLDPIKISHLLKELEKENKIFKKDGYWSIKIKNEELFLDLIDQDSELYLKKHMGYFNFLKNPHPLDFEWRNTAKSLNFLTDLIENLNGKTDKVLLLGMPTLYANCNQRNIPQNVTLVERNKPIVEALEKFSKKNSKIILEDIFSAKPDKIGKFYSVIMDPPWYSNFLYQFVWLASKCLLPGGVLVISIPPINTRERIDKERIDWFSYCQKQGLCIEKLEPEKLEYAMPFFEFNAFRQAGVSNTLPFWRKGDLAFFRKVEQTNSKRPKLEVEKNNWEELQIESMRLRVKINSNQIEKDEEIKITSLVEGDILPSVSRSTKIRDEANVWTTGNRIFKVNNPKKFWNILIKEENHFVCDWFEMIINLEDKEYKDYLAHIYYEMERDAN